MVELIGEIVSVVLPLILIPLGTFIGVEIAQLLRERLAVWRDGKYSMLAMRLVGWAHDKFPDLVESAKVQKAIDRMAKKIPGLDKKDIEEFVMSAHASFGLELGLGKAQFSSGQETS